MGALDENKKRSHPGRLASAAKSESLPAHNSKRKDEGRASRASLEMREHQFPSLGRCKYFS